MKTYKHSRGSLFLMELILNIFLFCVLMIIALRFFIKAHNLTIDTAQIHNSVTACTSVATLFEAGDGDLDILEKEYSYAYLNDNRLTIYFDETYNPCDEAASKFFMTVTLSESSENRRLHQADIQMFTSDKKEIYQITGYNYSGLTPSDKEVADEE